MCMDTCGSVLGILLDMASLAGSEPVGLSYQSEAFDGVNARNEFAGTACYHPFEVGTYEPK